MNKTVKIGFRRGIHFVWGLFMALSVCRGLPHHEECSYWPVQHSLICHWSPGSRPTPESFSFSSSFLPLFLLCHFFTTFLHLRRKLKKKNLMALRPKALPSLLKASLSLSLLFFFLSSFLSCFVQPLLHSFISPPVQRLKGGWRFLSASLLLISPGVSLHLRDTLGFFREREKERKKDGGKEYMYCLEVLLIEVVCATNVPVTKVGV